MKRWASAASAITLALAMQACQREPAPDTHVCTDSRSIQIRNSLTGDDLPAALGALKAQGVTFILTAEGDYNLLAGPPVPPRPTVLVIETTTQRGLSGRTSELLNFHYGADGRLTETDCQHTSSGPLG